MPAKKKTTTKKSSTAKKSTAQKSAPASAKKQESGLAFWAALLIVFLALGAGIVFATLPKLDGVEMLEVVEETDEPEVAETPEELTRTQRLEMLYDNEGVSEAFIAEIEEALTRNELVEVLSESRRPLDTYTVYAIPTTETNTAYCGVYGQRLCVLVRQENVRNVSILDVFDAQVNEDVPGIGTPASIQFTSGNALLKIAYNGQASVNEWNIAYDTETNASTLLGRINATDNGTALVVVGDVQFTTEVEVVSEEGVRTISRFALVGDDGAVDLTSVVGGVDETQVAVDWATALERPGEILFSAAGRDYVYNRDGNGTFIGL